MGAPGVPQAASMMQTSTIQASMMQAMLVIRFQLDGFISLKFQVPWVRR